uniref:Uncharacterized protein n=1 Tax=Nelumbo nucifera TaxID=4432 RepID=A0A822Z4W5_NELNU|nr:TPA_asm: hypothetical protein HUJ06_013063 [Nelumbo nucifera]
MSLNFSYKKIGQENVRNEYLTKKNYVALTLTTSYNLFFISRVMFFQLVM